jgi:tRNA-dihydrouridine synthase B
LRSEKRDIILRHVTALYDFHGEVAGVRIARKHLGWYCQHHSGTNGFRPRLMAAESSSSQYAVAEECFSRWAVEGIDKNKNENKASGSALEHRDAHESYEQQDVTSEACL